MKKRILILGAGDAQLNLIKTAKELGYYTIVCDMRSNTEGAKLADKYYQKNYMDKKIVYDIACIENIDGVVSNSEPAMVSVSYLVDKLALPGNSTKSLKKLLSKKNFRILQEKVGVYCPKSYTCEKIEDALEKSKKLKYPIIIKPSESSGSRGTTKIEKFNSKDVIDTFMKCREFSRNNMVTIEEFIEMESLEVINVDVFVFEDEYIWDGWYGGLRSLERPMIPMAKILPPSISEQQKQEIKNDVENLLRTSGVSLGEFNVETFFSKEKKLFVIEINPRQAGDDIPKLIKEHTGVDLTKLLVSLSVNDMSYYDLLKKYKRENNYITLQVVFSNKDGEYGGLYIDDSIKTFVCWVKEFVNKGEQVFKARNAEDSVAYVDLKFTTLELQKYFTNDIEKYIYPLIK